ncbi:MAG: hypothetical protein HOV94_14555, partial [Saccharothrix sp.]|nr:hypothetical protein [Saccharothrix sp.]
MRNSPTVLISGLHSGPNPSPGLGVARSLRRAWPDVRLHALDYSTGATGLSAPELDEVRVMPPWDTVDLPSSCAALVGLVAGADAVFIPGLDLEAEVLAEHRPGDRRLLVPPTGAFQLVRKPGTAVAAALGLRVPEFRRVSDPVEAVGFATAHGWRVWVKGSRYEAVAVTDRFGLTWAMDRVRRTWGDQDVLVQRHVDGHEESFVFAALDGELVGACAMAKTMLTPEGKTWAGQVGDLADADLAALAAFARRARWTGGGEVEMVRDATGERYLMEVNPRFPAWVHGATLAGVNLPARLVAAATGVPLAVPEQVDARDFVRVVHEVAARFTAPPARLDFPDGRSGGGSKHPSAMPVLSRRRADPVDRRPEPVEADPEVPDGPLDTPVRLLFDAVLADRVARVGDIVARVEAA